MASLQHEHKYALILFSIEMIVFVKTDCRVISYLKVEVRKPELKAFMKLITSTETVVYSTG